MEQDHKDYFPTDEELTELKKQFPRAKSLNPIQPGPREIADIKLDTSIGIKQ